MMDIESSPNWHSSGISSSSTHSSRISNGILEEIYPARYWPGEKICEHLEFALKYDGTDLNLLARIFEQISQEELTLFVKSKPTGKYVRRIWFFYEFLTGKQLPIGDLTSGNYVDALDFKHYFTLRDGENSSRHRIVNNLLGNQHFCPIVRRTANLATLDSSELREKCENFFSTYPAVLLRRALTYLYNKETKSSFEIENIKPSTKRTERFIASLELAEKEDFCTKERLIELHNLIVDARFKVSDYRTSQNYVGETAHQTEIIHFICPKPEDLTSLMKGLLECHNRIKVGCVDAIVHAAIISYGFVFLHPFEDGNGRIHRFLIHNILSIMEVLPPGLMFPVSAVMLKNHAEYDASLESFSRPLLKLIDYQLDEQGIMNVENETAYWYRYMDLTVQTEALYKFITNTIEEEVIEEITFLLNYDKSKRAIQDIVDMPDRKIDLFIRLCLQNNWNISARKRAVHFDFLTVEEISQMTQAVKRVYEHKE